jgi:YgiT-type zinc finger domain-containing protein
MAVHTEPEPRTPFTCPDCRLGTARATSVFYCTWVDGVFLTVPNFPAWICGVCGFREYDGEALHDLETVMRARRRPRNTPHGRGRTVGPTDVQRGRQ